MRPAADWYIGTECIRTGPSHPALRDGVIPRLLSSVCRAMAITRLTHLRLSIPLSGAPPGKVLESCYPDAETAVAQPLPRRVSFAEDVDTLHTKDDLPVSSETSPPLTQPVVEKLEEDTSTSEVDEIKICASQINPPLTQPVVEGMEDDTPTSEVDELDISSPESERPPPPEFPPFVFPEDDGGINADEICAHFGGYVTETCQQMDTGLPDIPEETEAPELVVPGLPSPNDMSDVMPAVGYACVPLPSVNNGVMPELMYGCLPSLRQRDGL